MNELSRKRSFLDHYIAMVVVSLMAVGTVFVCSASANLTNTDDLRRVVFFPAAVAVLLISSLVPYQWFKLPDKGFVKSLTFLMLMVSVVMLCVVLFTNLGTRVNNATRWLNIGFGSFKFQFQPSEIAKWAIVFFTCGYVTKYQDKLKLFWKGLVPPCLVAGIVVGLIVTQDLGTAAFISLLTGFMLLIGGARVWHLLLPLAGLIPAFVYVVLTSPNRLSRITAFLHPDITDNPAVYQARQSLIAISTGGVFGKGLGLGICKWGHLPEDTTDFIFAIIGEETGLVGTVGVIVFFMLFTFLGFMIVRKCDDPFGKILACGITLTVAIQASINIGVVTVVLPTKGIPLPFISAGGTSLLVSSAAVGVLLNIARQSCVEEMRGV